MFTLIASRSVGKTELAVLAPRPLSWDYLREKVWYQTRWPDGWPVRSLWNRSIFFSKYFSLLIFFNNCFSYLSLWLSLLRYRVCAPIRVFRKAKSRVVNWRLDTSGCPQWRMHIFHQERTFSPAINLGFFMQVEVCYSFYIARRLYRSFFYYIAF